MNKFFKRAGYVLLPVAIILLVAILKWESITYFGLRKIAQFYGDRSHIVFEVDRISGNPFSETTLDTVSIHPVKADPPTYVFKASTLTCTYNLWDLREGYEPFLRGLRCIAETPQFSYDLRSEALQPKSTDKSEQFVVPAVLPRVDLHNGSVILTHTGWDAEIRGINSSLSPTEAAHELQLAVENFRFRQEGVTQIETGFTSSLRYSGAELFIDSFEVGEDEMSATGIIDLARLDKGYTGFAADLAFAENQLNIAGSMENRLFQLHIKTENFDTGELQKRLGGIGWDFSGKIKGTADLTVNLESEHDIKGAVTLGVQKGQIHGVGIDALFLDGSFDNKSIIVSSAEARTPGNHVVVSDLSVPMPLALEGDIRAIIGSTRGAFKVDLKDVQTVLRLFKVEDKVIPQVRPDLFSVSGYLDNKIIAISEAEVRTPGNHVVVSDLSVPMPLVLDGDFLAIIGGARAVFKADMKEVQTLLQLFKAEDKVIPQARPDLLIVSGYLENGALYLDEARTQKADSSLVIDRAVIPIPATAEAFESVQIDLAARFESSNLQELAGLFGDIPVNGQVSADMSITGSMKESKASISLSGEDLSIKDLQIGLLAMQAEVRLIQEKPGKVKSIEFDISEMTQINGSGILAMVSPATGTWQDEYIFNGCRPSG